jgi:sulfur-oxidizing protein SoxB
MFNRRDFLQTMAASAILMGGTPRLVGAAARQAITQDQLLAFEPLGQVTLLHLADLHAQLRPAPISWRASA